MAFRIFVSKRGRRPFDIENVGKLIIDAFCKRQIEKGGSPHSRLALYPDDSVDHVIMLLAGGRRTDSEEEIASVEIFAVRPSRSSERAEQTRDEKPGGHL